MNRIIAPLKPGDRGPEVANLQDALTLLLDRGRIAPDPKIWEVALRNLAVERASQEYGSRATYVLVHLFQTQHALPATGQVDSETADKLNSVLQELGVLKESKAGHFVVHGKVSYASGFGAPGLLVRAYDKDMRSEQLLGETKTDHAGKYQISYRAEKYALAEVGGADLRISVCNAEGQEVATSQVLFNASAEEVIDVTLPASIRGPSEYSRLVAAITPDLEGVALQDLTSADIQFLAGDTGEDAKRIAWIAGANGANRSVDGIPADIFYGLYRQALPTDLSALSKSSQKTLLAAIQSSISQNVIRSFTDKEIQAYLSILQRFAVENELKPAPEKQPASLGDLLALTSLAPEKQKKFAAAWVSRTDTGDAFWQQAQKSAGLTDAETTQLRTTTELGNVTGGYVPLVKELQQRMQSDPALKSVAALASYDLQAWKAVVKAVGPPPAVTGATLDERITTYATSVLNAFEFNHPTAVISSRIQQGLFGFDDKQKTDLGAFLANNPKIEFGEAANPVGIFLNGKTVNWNGVADQAGTTILLSNIDRVSKLTSNAAQTATLLKDGYQSAYAIVSAGKLPLQEKYGNDFGMTQIEQIYDRGLTVYNSALLAFVGNHPILRLPLPYVLTGVTLADTASIDVPPDWRSIFGSIDICECTECSSLYGPSAYLVDILNSLKKGTTLSGLTPLDVLLERRPDIAQVELTCDNTDTELSYIDLVNEILEQALVSRSWDMNLALLSNTVTVLNQGQVPDALRQELLAKFYPLTSSAEIEIIKQGLRWDLRDVGWRFTLINKKSFPFTRDTKITISAWPQTGWKEAELAASAEHLTPTAYDKFLSQAVYPGTLPFDLWLEMVRVYLNHLGVPRSQLMETFFNGDFDSAVSNPAIVNEHLGFSQLEADICTGKQTQDPNKPITLGGPERIFDFWGLIQIVSIPDPAGGATPIIGPWDAVLQHVDIFLNQSGLSYVDLLELLECYFINPVLLDANGKPKRDAHGRLIRALTLVSSDANDQATCDPHKLRINGLTASILKNIHRFLRLSRKLGWIFRDVDRALTAIPVVPPLDSATNGALVLQYLSHAMRLGSKLSIPPQNVLAWWSQTLDTNQYLDHTTDTQSLVPSVYDSIFRTKSVTTSSVDLFASTQNQPATTPPVDLFELDADRQQLKYLSAAGAVPLPIRQSADRVMAALNISSDDLELLLDLTAAQIKSMLALTGTPLSTPDQMLAAFLATSAATLTALSGYPNCPVLDAQTLWSLSFLYRVSSFAKALQISISDFLKVWQFASQPPLFGSSLDTIHFAYRTATIRSTSFTIADLDYLLRHEFLPSSPAASDDQTIALLLANLRASLLQIAKDNTFRNDPSDPLNATSDSNGDLTRSKLALLNWNSDLITQVVTTLKGTVTYQVQLTNPLPAPFSIPNAPQTFSATLTAPLPPGFALPSALNGVVIYDATTVQLTATRPLTVPERTLLNSTASAVNITAFTNGVGQLLALQDGLNGDLNYDSTALVLSFRGPMTVARKSVLINAPGATTEFSSAVQTLFDAPRMFIARNMRTFSVIDFSADLGAHPPVLVFPASLGGRAYTESDGTTTHLHYTGVMSVEDQAILISLSGDLGYQGVVSLLFQQPSLLVPAQGDAFLNTFGTGTPPPFGPDIAALFDGNAQPADRFSIVLQKLLPYLKQKLSSDFIVQSTATAFQLDSRSAESLLSTWLTATLDPGASPPTLVPCLTVWLDPAFAESNPNTTMSRDNFLPQFLTYIRVQKAAMTISKFKFTFVQLGWLFEHGSTAGWLDLNSLPLEAGKGTASFEAWRRTAALAALRDALPDGETLLSKIFAIAYAAPAPADPTLPIRTLLTDSLQWNEDDLSFLTGVQGFSFTTLSYYQDERALQRLLNCFDKLKRLGVSAQQSKQWCATKLTVTDAISAKSAARSKYKEADWLQRAKPLNDVLRGKQRNALVAYLIANPQKDAAGRPLWTDDDGLYGYYLIDVDMGTCMKTSRLVQATASAQLFVQRCLLNLESGVSIDGEQAKEWNQWRKYYRVWEANREVFLYPENWIEPELRDDKTPFFKGLENELLQGNITSDSAEDALAHYLEKLHQVARLEIVAIYHEIEAAASKNGLDADINRLHVVGRTTASPNVYYYRKLENSLWSSWEKMDVDITGDHLILGVTNRRLYAFWPIFKEQTAPNSSSQPLSSSDLTPQPSLWMVQIAASSYRDGRWSAKKLSSDTPLSCPKIDGLALKEAFTFRRIGTPDNFTINCFATENIVTGPAPVTFPQPADNVTPWAGSDAVLYVYVVDPANGNKPIPLVEVTINSTDFHQVVDSNGNYSSTPINSLSRITDSNGHAAFFWPVPPDHYTIQVLPPSSDYDVNSLAAVSPADLTQDIEFGNIYTRYLLLSGKPSSQPAQTTVQELLQIGFFSLTCGEELVATPFDGNQIVPAAYDTYIDGMMLDSNQNSLAPPLYLSADQSRPIFTKTAAPFSLLLPNDDSSEFVHDQFFQDDVCTYYIRQTPNAIKIEFIDFYHPYVCNFLSALYAKGLSGLLTLETQQLSDAVSLNSAIAVGKKFYLRYGLYDAPGSLLDIQHLPREIVDFSPEGAYSIYNWELFFHIPFEIAVRLSTNQRFEEAQEWFHYIFDPTASGTPATNVTDRAASFWKFKPFHDLLANPPQSLQDLLNDASELNTEVKAWAADPFNPHLIARFRHLAYMKSVVMKYIENLLDWGDMLFTSDTRETDAEATQIYILAAQILGKRPERRPARATSEVSTYDSITASGVSFDQFSNAMVAIESFIFPSGASTGTSNPPVQLPYFCLSGNDVLLGYWDRVADRLFKLRNCMNIEGVVRDLPLFQPPIDPAILVRAAAAGVDLSSVLSDLNAPLPYYRFNVLLQKAMEMCNEVKSLGGAFLSALEKRDGEALAALRSQHDIQTLTAMKAVKEQQLAEATNNLTAAQQSLAVVQVRKAYYQGLVQAGASTPGPTPPSQGSLGNNSLKLNANESMQLSLMGQALSTQLDQSTVELLGGILSLIPDVKIGAPTTDGASFGGAQLGSALRTVSSYMGSMISMMNATASMSGIVGGHERRSEEWQFQLNLATAEATQFTTQVAAAAVREAMAQADLDAQKLQIDNANDVDAFLREKYTNEDLYVWMIGQLAGTYFQSYQLAYSLAKRAEQCYRYELGLDDSSFIQFGYWDSLKKGLLAGERLAYDLRRMDSAYLDQNRREYEIVKHVSVLALDPYALLQLKETGECTVNIPEAVFDLDFPGHYLRRIKSVGVTVPCVTGPYTSIPCTLTLLKSTLRRVSQLNSGTTAYARSSANDPRFVDIAGGTQSIVTSSGQNDSGLFETNLRDERFLPFEGMGAVSEWRLQLPADLRQFDYNTISDVILHLRYTARDGGGTLRDAAAAELQKAINAAVSDSQNNGAFRLFSARQEFPDAWYQFLQTLGTASTQAITFPVISERFPFVFRTRNIQIASIDVIVNFNDAYLAKNDPSKLQWTFAPGTTAVALATGNPIPTPNSNLQPAQWAGTLWIDSKDANTGPGNWTLGLWPGTGVAVPNDFIEDIFLICKYTIA